MNVNMSTVLFISFSISPVNHEYFKFYKRFIYHIIIDLSVTSIKKRPFGRLHFFFKRVCVCGCCCRCYHLLLFLIRRVCQMNVFSVGFLSYIFDILQPLQQKNRFSFSKQINKCRYQERKLEGIEH